MAELAEKFETPFLLGPGGWTGKIGGEKVYHWVWRNAPISGQSQMHFCRDFVPKELGYKKGIIIEPDYAYGHDMLKAAKHFFKEGGVEVIQEVIPPFPTMDFAPYLGGLNKEADFLLSNHAGSDAVRLVKQFKEYGMWKHMALLGGDIAGADLAPAEGEAAVGIVGSYPYNHNLEFQKNIEFVKKWRAKFKEPSCMLEALAYTSAKVVLKAVEKIGGNVEDKEAFLKALSEVELEGPTGHFRFDKETHNALLPEAIWEITGIKEGEPIYKLLKVYTTEPGSVAEIFRKE